MTQEDYDKYLEIRTSIQDVIDNSVKETDKKVYSTGTWALGLSVALLSFIGKNPEGMCILYLCWFFVGTSIVLNIYSHISSQSKAENTVKDIDALIVNDSSFDYKEINNIISKRNKNTKIINWVTFSFLWIGIFFLMIFIIKNS